ncbi:hypothetical protein SAMN05421770_107120 [Granulicella rosea]|uniref:Uncharacterized protein n=1 Tax=Granulicella rosea TaxID=474952 RepID=A0A239LN96_9BACT|nr:hypothetical protein [Granulicella rosea]SNT31293.1 hypothetical protein SAMN05421770_107120 [Granulicella rosea]
MNASEKHEQAIEKVLGGLREVQAPAGLEQRVLRRVAEMEAAGPRPVWQPVWLASLGRGRSMAYGLAVAALIAGGAALLAVRRPVRMGLDSAQGFSAARTAEDAPDASKNRQRHEPRQGAFAALRTTSSLGDGRQKAIRSKRLSGVFSDARRPATPEDAAESKALSDTLAASHPAPPMPLTEQERLLLKIAHTGDPEELAALNPELRDRALAKGAADFRAFFPPPPPLVVER